MLAMHDWNADDFNGTKSPCALQCSGFKGLTTYGTAAACRQSSREWDRQEQVSKEDIIC
jgi:hypothetical protein